MKTWIFKKSTLPEAWVFEFTTLIIDKWQPLSFSVNWGIASLNKNKTSYMAFFFPFYGIDYHVFFFFFAFNSFGTFIRRQTMNYNYMSACFWLHLFFFSSSFNNIFCAFLLHVFSGNGLYTPVLFPFLWLTVRPLAPKALVHTPQTLERQDWRVR